MRNLIIIGILGCVAFAAGWFTIHREGDKTTIQFNRAEIRQDTRRVIEKGREILDKRSDQFVNQQSDPQQDFQQDPRYADRNGGYPQQAPSLSATSATNKTAIPFNQQMVSRQLISRATTRIRDIRIPTKHRGTKTTVALIPTPTTPTISKSVGRDLG